MAKEIKGLVGEDTKQGEKTGKEHGFDISHLDSTVQDHLKIVHRLTLYKKGKNVKIEHQPLLVVYEDATTCLVKNEGNVAVLINKVGFVPSSMEKSFALFVTPQLAMDSIVQDTYWDNGQVLCYRVYSKSFEKAKQLIQSLVADY